ncbi:imelysin family protein [Rhizobium helianthi]|uniref:Imelysin family protein n=1 Tax=Rhizobium helianthi TaxID=1132695 RepID=A0ABW4M2K4_9HYPH
MRIFLFALGMTLLAVGSSPAQDANPSPPPVLTREKTVALMEATIEKVIEPGYRDFTDKAGQLTDRMMQLCSMPSQTNLEQARDAFARTARSWGRIEIVRVGPVLEQNRFERVLFYPDKKGLGLRQVQALLASADETATSPATLAGKSVAVQGLGALEFVLHGTGWEEVATKADSYRCRYGLAIAGNIQRIGTELVQAWNGGDGIARDWKNPGPDSAAFRTNEEAVTAVLGILVHASEALRDQRIETFYKGPEAQAFPRQALFWRSGLSFAMLTENLEGVQTMLDESGIATLLNEDQQSIVSSIDFVLKSLINTISRIDPDVEKAVTNPEDRQKLDFALLNSRDLIIRLNDNLGGGLGLGAGFSFSDGD